ncbi:MAG: hypothetical protein RDV48_31460 [Candidatus Eremiobacteraeota bacterium]|nr:hypothetical protein [Candidatus Eremiobacteraeota bacterium]
MSEKNGALLTLKEASQITGIAVPALRMRLKSGKISGLKTQTKHGEAWYIKPDTIRELSSIEPERLNSFTLKSFNPEKFKGEFNPERGENLVLKAKDEVIEGLKKHLGTYETLLTTFQERILNLEAEKGEMESKIKLLPAPAEEVAERFSTMEKELERKNELMTKAKKVLNNVQIAIQQKDDTLEEMKTKLEEEAKAKENLSNELVKVLEEMKRPFWQKALKALGMWR